MLLIMTPPKECVEYSYHGSTCLQPQWRSRDDEDYVVGGLHQALIGKALQITERASDRMFRHEAAADFIADDDDLARGPRGYGFLAPQPHGVDQVINLRQDQLFLLGVCLLPEFPHQIGDPE